MDKGYLVAKIPNHFFLTCCYCFHFAFKMCLLLIPLGAAKTRRTFPVRFDKRLTFISVSPVPTPPIRPPESLHGHTPKSPHPPLDCGAPTNQRRIPAALLSFLCECLSEHLERINRHILYELIRRHTRAGGWSSKRH